MRHSIKAALIGMLLLGSMAANAGPITWAFNYSGTGVSASGLLSTDDLSGGSYLINGISGQRNGEAILGLVPAGTIFTPGGSLFSNNLLYPVSPVLDYLGFTYQTSSGAYNVCSAGPGCSTSGYWDINGNNIAFTSIQFSVTRVSEPGTLVMMCLGLGLLGLAVLKRKQVA